MKQENVSSEVPLRRQLYSLLTSPASPTHSAQEGGASPEQEPEVVPVPAPRLVVEWELLPTAKHVHD